MTGGRSAIVTGGASGIGQACAMQLAAGGWRVTVSDRDGEEAERVADAIRAAGGEALALCTDVSAEEQVKAAIDQAVEAFGGLHAAINCAGVHQTGRETHELDAESWSRVIAVNLTGMFYCFKHQISAMLESGGGAIVGVSSAAAIKGLVNSADYCASKAGITGLTRAAAVDYADRGLRINALLPGATDTPLAKASQKANPKIVGTLSVPMQRMASPDEIAASAVWLVSDSASYITGACISADGGLSAI